MSSSHAPRQPPAGPPLPGGRVYRLTYPNIGDDIEPKLFQCRDGMAFCELYTALVQEGYRYETAINLFPNDQRKLTAYPVFRAGDTFVMTTRPPLSDDKSAASKRDAGKAAVAKGAKAKAAVEKKTIVKNLGPVEDAVLLQVIPRYFSYLSRQIVMLKEDLRERLQWKPAVTYPEHWYWLEFFENRNLGKAQGPEVKAEDRRFWTGLLKNHSDDKACATHVPVTKGKASTVGFWVHDRMTLAGVDTKVMLAWGMDGYCTLIWNRVLRKHPEFLRHRFLMAEVVFKKLPGDGKLPPLTAEFADDPEIVEVNVLATLDG